MHKLIVKPILKTVTINPSEQDHPDAINNTQHHIAIDCRINQMVNELNKKRQVKNQSPEDRILKP